MPNSPSKEKPKTIFLKDYRPPDYFIKTVDLHFDLGEEVTTVRSLLTIASNGDHPRPLVLDGRELILKSIKLNAKSLTNEDYTVDDESLTLPRTRLGTPEAFTLEIETEIKPQANTSLSGLYTSGGNFCTQCEAEGFRKITYFPDRPDVMSRYTATLTADKSKYPVLLSNGNLLEQGELSGNKHWAKWQDPFPKPAYLFALVAGDLTSVEDQFVTQSGKTVRLYIYVQHHNVDKCEHALNSLKKAMQWDEQTYGREYDLDRYMIVAVDDFNMGAMENKGLNVFNSRYVLAKPETATDSDYQAIEGVIGHEYFHNWSGNRVTCRDWFQLSLKEGFTVFRDQEFSADMTSRGVKRIHDVNLLRTHQFREDAGPMAHPVRPASYVEINNFYTMTVYNKGAEVLRMLRNLSGSEGFRKGTDLYFQRHDGQAVTTDDFVKALEDANDMDFSQFRLWYSQAGTPQLHFNRTYDPLARTYTLTVKQACPPTPGQSEKKPFHIPLAIGLLDREGNDLPLQLKGEQTAVAGTRVLPIRKAEESFVFVNIPDEPVPSLLRDFSAPAKIYADLSDTERFFLMAHDSDPFNRWEAGQQMAVKVILGLVNDIQQGNELRLKHAFVEAFHQTLQDKELDKAMIAQALTLPSETYLADFMEVIDPTAIHEACRFVRRTLAEELKLDFQFEYEANADFGPYQIDPHSVGRRSLRNTCLSYLMELVDVPSHNNIVAPCVEQFRRATNMTDVMAALVCLANSECGEREPALNEFYEKWHNDSLVVDKWLTIQATSRLPNTLENVKSLTQHPAFNLKNPNKVRALIGSFTQGNPVRFHDKSGEGYGLLGDYILQLDPLNPQIAARLITPLSYWRKYDETRKTLMKGQLERILNTPSLSKDVYEIVSKSLAE